MRFFRIRLFTAAALVACAALSSVAQAQTQGGGPSPIPLNPAAPKGGFHGSLTTGISIETGRTDLTGTQVLFQGQRSYSSTGLFTTSLSYTHATTEPPGRSTRITVANRLDAGFGLEQNVKKHGILMARSQVLRDPIARINYRFEEMVGLGLRKTGKRAELRVVPGLAFLWDDKNLAAEPGYHTHYGFYQDLRVQLSPTFIFLETVAASRNFTNSRDRIANLDARLLGMITKIIGIQLSYTYNYESILPPGVDHEYAKTIAGVQIKF